MMVTVPMRAALGFAVTLVASSLAIEARAQDASPWQRDGHSAVRLLAGSRSGAGLLGGIAFQLQPGWKTYWRTPRRSRVPPPPALRLLAGSRSGAVLLGGIAFQLQPGWKSYWRTPGDSGVPPRFDFSKSENVEAVTVLWPAPKKFEDSAGGVSPRYHAQIVLPLRIVARNVDKPVTLRAEINYAVCEKLCIPVQANADLAFNSVRSRETRA